MFSKAADLLYIVISALTGIRELLGKGIETLGLDGMNIILINPSAEYCNGDGHDQKKGKGQLVLKAEPFFETVQNIFLQSY